MSPVGLAELLAHLPIPDDPDLLVGYATSDDAAIYRLGPDTALVATVDVITPPCDDGRRYGEITAANALSDVYAMGGKPLLALSLVAFPSHRLPATILHEMVAGAAAKVVEAGAVLAGGHSIEDDEPKLGFAVVGLVHPDRIWTNGGARPGDLLLLTKPIGSGAILNGRLQGVVDDEAFAGCLDALATLNRSAAEALGSLQVHAATDVTGFGLAGHALEMARASGVTIEIEASSLPVYAGAEEAIRRGARSLRDRSNRELVQPHLDLAADLDPAREALLFDPQTSGGLLVSLPSAHVAEAMAAIGPIGPGTPAVVGRVTAAGDARIRVI